MTTLIRFYRNFSLLNLDVVAGAVITSLFFSKQFGTQPNRSAILTLGLTVWIIYTADRLLDIRGITAPPASERHRFHYRNQKFLWWIIAAASLTAAGLVFTLPAHVFTGGLCLSGFVGAYLFLQRYLAGKEVFVAVLYTTGVLLPALPVQLHMLSIAQLFLIGQLLVVVLVNLLLFSLYEFETDKADGHQSSTTRWGRKPIAIALVAFCLINFLMAAWAMVNQLYFFAQPILLIMNSILLLVFLWPTVFSKNLRYRFVGDAVFFLPLTALI